MGTYRVTNRATGETHEVEAMYARCVRPAGVDDRRLLRAAPGGIGTASAGAGGHLASRAGKNQGGWGQG